MFIKEFMVPEDDEILTAAGLKAIKMRRLGRYIAIAGKNGSGKSRLLNVLEEKINNHVEFGRNIVNIRARLKANEEILTSRAEEFGDFNTVMREEMEKKIKADKDYLKQNESRILTDNNRHHFKAVRFVPKKFVTPDPASLSPRDAAKLSHGTKDVGVENLAEGYFSYIQNIQDRWWFSLHPRSSEPLQAKEAIAREYDNLRQIVEAFLNVPLERLPNNQAGIFSKPLADSKLSQGQQIMLQLAVAVHAQGSKLDNTVFILDELENHLHPSAVIDVLSRMETAAPNSQIWLATHSIPLLAHVLGTEPMALWYMASGEIRHSGSQPEVVLASLLGDESRIAQLHAFTGLPAQLAALNFACESLMPPKVVEAGRDDPQIAQISRILNKRPGKQTVLDYGCGKGRLLEGIVESDRSIKISGRIDYLAYDSSNTDKAACIAIIKESYLDAQDRYFKSDSEFFERKDDSSVDVVVMCNVLHEIPPKNWLSLFSPESLILRALKDDGYLLLVEDQRIPIGEKAHEHGFLVLDTQHLRTLFNISEDDIDQERFLKDDHRKDGRLKAHLIQKPLLKNICADRRSRAINEVRESAIKAIEKLRGDPYTYHVGQLHGFWTQQLANAFMFIRENGHGGS